MEQMTHEQSEQVVKCINVQPAVEKRSDLESNILSRTPAKANETLPIKHKTEAGELPEKYKTISEFFDRMTSSLRLLSLRKKSPTFKNICSQVQILTGRKFSYKHLAQIKFILPEAVETERILIHDEKTKCMEPEMIITLLFDIVKGHDEQSDYLALRVVFASRLFDFYSTHTESCEIPEAALPEPFNKRSISTTADALPVDSTALLQSNHIQAELLNSSHLHSSFSRHFSQKDLVEETEKTRLLASPIPLLSIKYDRRHQDTEPQSASPDSCIEPAIATNPVQLTNPPCFSSVSCESTPIKLPLKSENLMIETPAQSTPQRSQPSCDKLKTTTILKRTASNMSAKRTLDFTYSEGEDRLLNSTADGILLYEVAPNMIPQGETKSFIEENNTASLAAPLPKVSSCCSSSDNVINRSASTSNQQISCCLPDLVAIIDQIFQYANCSSITKEELVHKIIMNTLDIVERREVEEQIEQLEKLVPDWIGKKLAPSGDILYNIKKVSDLKSVCERLICI